jgi:membrane protein YqaA with SNARE-associated domain
VLGPLADLLGLLAVGFASALIPLVNIEAYLGVRGAVSAGSAAESLWLLGLTAAVGQMAGKLVWYRLGASSLHWGWVRRRVETPSAQARLSRWRRRTADRPVLAGALVFGSAFGGLPPFAILAVVAGQLGMSLTLFVTLGLLGRWLRFSAVLGGAEWVTTLLR